MLAPVHVSETTRLLAAALDGETSARGNLLERLRPRIVLWVSTRLSDDLRSKLEPEDVAQDVLLALHKGLDGFENREPRAFMAWIFTVAENRIRDAAKHFAAKKRQLPEPRCFDQSSPSSIVSRAEQLDRVRAAVLQLPPDYREVLRLRSFEEKSYPETAKALGRSEGATRVLHCRALAALRDELTSTDQESGGGHDRA